MSETADIAERLRAARTSAGYPTAKAFWSRHNIAQATYQNHEAGTRAISPKQATRYAQLLEVTPAWLLTGAGEAPLLLAGPGQRNITIPEVDVRAEGDSTANPTDLLAQASSGDEWHMPMSVLTAHTSAPSQNLRIIRVHGDSMRPVFNPGDRVLVDLSDMTPSPPGIFLLWDGLGVVIKRIEFIAYSDPKRVRFSAANPAYQDYECPLADVVINGRVIAKWDWT